MGQFLWHIKMKPTKKRSLALLLCETKKENLNEVKIRFIKSNTVSLQTVQIQNVKIVSLCSTDQVKFHSADDTVWSVLKSLSRATIVPTWAACYSLLNESIK